MARTATAPTISNGQRPLSTRRTLVAGATKVRLEAGERAVQAQLGRRERWQGEAWAYFDDVPEVKQLVWFLGNAMAKLRLFVAVPDPDDPDGDPIPAADENSGVPPEVAARAEAELARLRGEFGGQGEILRGLNMNLEVPGEAFIVGFAARAAVFSDDGVTVDQAETTESWEVKSTSEVLVKGKETRILQSEDDQKGRLLDPDIDTIIRIWQRHPQWSHRADSAMRGVLGECRALMALSNQVIATANSQMHAGILLVPNELSFGPADPTTPEDGDEAGQDPFEDELDRSFSEPLNYEDSMATVRPMLVRGESQYLHPNVFRLLTLSREFDSTLDARIEERVTRLARGLNAPVEVVEGHQQTTFANAKQVDQDTYEDHLESRCILIVDGLTVGFLRPNLSDPDSDPVDPEWVDRLMVWFDPSRLVAKPDAEAAADSAHERFAISNAAYRKARGFGEGDAPDALELIIRAGLKRGALSPEITAALLAELADEAGVDLPTVEQLAPGGTPIAPAAAVLMQALALEQRRRQVSAGRRSLNAGAAVDNLGGRLVAIDQQLRTQLLVASNAALERALERAGNRLRSKVSQLGRDLVRQIDPRLVAATLGPSLTAATADDGDLMAGAFDALEAQFMTWAATAQDEAIGVASQIVGGFDRTTRDALKLRQAADLTEAWGWLRSTLEALATARLFDPDPSAPDLGEFDPSLKVPTGLVRQAIARAGGTAGLQASDEGGAWVVLTDGGTRPAGGIATGQVVMGALRDGGAHVEAYQWVYGPGFRKVNFEPHLALDGRVFRNFDDPVLTNSQGWPPYEFFIPGDHAHCQCDAMPVIVPADQLS